MVGRQCREPQGFAIRASEGENLKTWRSVRLLDSIGARQALEARLSDEFFQRIVGKLVNILPEAVGEFRQAVLTPAPFSFLI